MLDNEANGLLIKVLEHEGEPTWSDDTELADLPGIDSLKQLALILAIEERRGRKLGMEELMELETVADLKRLLASETA